MAVDFVHLHAHSDFSLLDGGASITNMVDRVKELGQTALALTDHGNLFGALRFFRACTAQGIHPIIGCEVYVAPQSRFEREKEAGSNRAYYHLVLLAENETGYRNLMLLSSKGYTEGLYYKPRVDEELLRAHSEGLICLSGCLAGQLPQLLLAGNMTEAEELIRRYRDIFGSNNYFIELQQHGISDEERAAPLLIDAAKRLGVPMVVTNDSHYARKEDAVAHDVLLCIGMKKSRSDPNRMKFASDDFYIKSAEQMAKLFPEYPEMVLNTVRIARRCQFDFPKPGPLLPEFDAPAEFSSKSEYLTHLVFEGLDRRYGTVTDEIHERAKYELDVIISMNFVGYFLIVWDFIDWAKQHDIPVGPGRGSGAGSIVAYALRITDIDPLRYNLLFERFLNPDRVSMPDFDVDFCFERRQEVIDYVRGKYGHDRVGQIITFGTLKPKAAIKDVARALNIPLSTVNTITKLIPNDPKLKTFAHAYKASPELSALKNEGEFSELFEIAEKLQGLNRNSSLHAAGLVIGKTALTDYVPLYKDSKTGIVATQFTMDLIEDCGLVKMDFLGLKTLTLITNTERLIRKRGGEFMNFSAADISDGDKKTYQMLGEGRSVAVFQFESEGMQNILKRAKPDKIEDLIALNALYRPGPMDNIDKFIEGKKYPEKITYPDPCLEDFLSETYGIIVYQEQVMQVARRIAKYSLGQADLLRRAMSKKKPEVMQEEKVRFTRGAVDNGFKKTDAERIFDILIPFAGYGFNKSHAAAYAVLAYQTAYLKANFPAEFLAANLTNEINSVDKMPEYIAEAKRMSIDILPPDVNRSDVFFTVDTGQIIYGLLGIKGLGEHASEQLVQERSLHGQYTSFMDVLERVDLKTLTKKNLEVLIKAGCFDSLYKNRAALFFNLDRAYSYAAQKKSSKSMGQVSLFEDAGIKEFSDFQFEEAPDWIKTEKLRLEKELIGLYISGHPLDEYREVITRSQTLDLSLIGDAQKKKVYTLVGKLAGVRTSVTKKGATMAFIAFEDLNGSVDVVAFPKTYNQYRNSLIPETICGITGTVETTRDPRSFVLEEVIPLETLQVSTIHEVHIRLDSLIKTEKQFKPVRDFLFAQEGNCSLFIHTYTSTTRYCIQAGPHIRVPSDDEFITQLRNLPGVTRVWKE